MKYLVWQDDNNNNDHEKKGKLLNVLLTNRSFAEIFEGDNPLFPVGQTIRIHQKIYRITRFEKIGDMTEIGVIMAVEVDAA